MNLTKANFNLTEVQNIFKSGETCDVSLFQYDEENNYTQLLANNPTLNIYEGGFRYLPILHNIGTTSASAQTYTLTSPIAITVPVGTGAPSLGDFTPQITVNEDEIGGGTSNYYFTASVVAASPVPYRVFVTFNWTIPSLVLSGTGTATIQPGNSISNDVIIHTELDYPSYDFFSTTIEVASISGGSTSSTGSFSTYYTTQVTSSNSCILFNTSSRQLVFNSTIAQYYNTLGIKFNSKIIKQINYCRNMFCI